MTVVNELNPLAKEDSNDGEGIDISDSWLDAHLSGQKPYTHRLAKIWQCELSRETNYQPVWRYNGVAASRLIRFLEHDKEYYRVKKTIKLKDGREMDVLVKKQFIHLKDDPVIYLQFAEDSKDPQQHKAYEASVKAIKEGLTFNGKQYEYCFSSGSQLRELKGVFVLKDYRLSEQYLSRFNKSIKGIEEYLAFLRTLRGAEAILEVMTYGAYSHEFSSAYKEFLNEEYEDIYYSCSKFMARVGMAGTASESLGTGWRVKHMGKVKFKFTHELEEMLRNYEVIDRHGVSRRLYSEEDIAEIKANWKEEKLDGQSIGRASTISRALRKKGFRVSKEECVGRLLQIRWAGVKGTILVLPNEVLDMCRDPHGKHIYRNYDLIIEHNSWKYGPTEFYTGEVGPELELVNLSKKKYSNFLNYQFLLALDGDNNNPSLASQTVFNLIDKQIESVKMGMVDQLAAAKKLGLTQHASPLDDFGIDTFGMSQRNKISKALGAEPRVIYDKWFRKKFLDLFRRTEDECKVGKIEVDGANRYVISDTIAMLRTDLIEVGEDGLENIVITSTSEVGLRHMSHCYWSRKDQEAVLFRSPCIHPGEPQRVLLTNNIVESISTSFGNIPVRSIYDSIKDIVVVNGFSNILESLGGADTDGDTVLCVTDPSVIDLRDPMRKSLMVKIDSGSNLTRINPESIKENMVFSLKNNGIGLITNYATTWRDIQLSVVRDRGLKDRKIISELKERIRLANENLMLKRPWSIEDQSLVAIANMDLRDWKSIYRACNAALKELRKLQEMSINTAKSGVFVEFGSKDPDVNNYNHLAVGIRADWHRPWAPDKRKYQSSSILADINKYSVEKWEALEVWSYRTAQSLTLGLKANYGADYAKIFDVVDSLRVSYGKEIYQMQREHLGKEEFNSRFEAIASDYHTKLVVLSAEYGIDLVAIAAYDSSNKDTDRNDKTSSSFVWNCFFEEFLATLEFFKGQSVSSRIYKVLLKDEFTYERFATGGMGTVANHEVFLDGVAIGTTSLEDGDYNISIIDGIPYLEVETVSSTVEELTASLKGIAFPILGFGFNPDLVTGEGKLTRANVVSYIQSDIANNIMETREILLGDNPSPRIACYIKIAGGKMLIGTIPYDEKLLMNALDNKVFRVVVLEEGSASRIMVRVEEVLEDLLG